MPPDPGSYEERYRLTSGVVLRLASGLLLVALGLVWQPPAISAASVILAIPVIFSALTIAFVMPAVITIARRMTAFRADYGGITLGVMPTSLAALHRPAIFIPWAEVEKIILYQGGVHDHRLETEPRAAYRGDRGGGAEHPGHRRQCGRMSRRNYPVAVRARHRPRACLPFCGR